MNSENRILILTGLALLSLTMFFGVWYAVFDEHQTLVGMGVSMASGFVEAARGDLDAAYAALEEYGRINREYRRELHFHGHWGLLGLVLLVYGMVAHSLSFAARTRVLLAVVLALSAFAFPLGVYLQIGPAHALGKVLSMLGSAGMVLGMLALTVGILRRSD